MDAITISTATSMIISLLVIFALLFIFAFFVKKYRLRLGVAKSYSNINISVLSTFSLGLQQSLVVAEADGQRFLLGVFKGGITLISQLDRHD